MRKSGSSIIVFVLVGFAVIGIGMQLVTNPAAFFQNVLVWVGGAVLFGALLYFILTRLRGRSTGGSSSDMQKYKQAVKQSKQKYKQPKATPAKKTTKSAASITKASAARKKRSVKDRSRAPQLRVIEGNKQKRKKSSI
ncbi:SA1362 family protein [Terribacillus halophilus]|uniref:SA1362 family protein n=1 Tax=Terribacillus halophilus TaxID=361279 RepID=UPI0009870FE5|nr:SA1362 family protein [Terribacillus halophilus]